MRRELILFLVTCGLFSACTSDSITIKSENDNQFIPAVSLNSVLESGSPQTPTEKLLSEEILESSKAPGNRASGKYLTVGGHKIVFTANENKGGVHGRGKITGPYYVDLSFRTVCIEVVDNRATYAGEVLSVELSDPDPEVPIVPGSIIYLAVEDNGEGSRNAADRYHEQVYVGPAGLVACESLTPINPFLWYEAGWFDTAGKNDQIQVK